MTCRRDVKPSISGRCLWQSGRWTGAGGFSEIVAVFALLGSYAFLHGSLGLADKRALLKSLTPRNGQTAPAVPPIHTSFTNLVSFRAECE